MKRTKLIASLMMCVFCLSFLVVGVWATVTSVNFNLNGNLQFYPEGIYVELSGQVYRGDSLDTLEPITSNSRFTLEKQTNFDDSTGEPSGNFPIKRWDIGSLPFAPQLRFIKIEVNVTNYSDFEIIGTPTIEGIDASDSNITVTDPGYVYAYKGETGTYELVLELKENATEITSQDITISFDIGKAVANYDYFTIDTKNQITGLDTEHYKAPYPEILIVPGVAQYGTTPLSIASGTFSSPIFKSLASTTVILQGGLTSIGYYAFYGCSGLTSIEIPSSVTSIGVYAFENCSSLTSIEIPSSVTSIGNAAFSGCSSLTSIEIPNSVTSIGNSAFYECRGLTSIEIPNSVTSIGPSAFTSCTSLTSIEIPSSVTSIGDNAFYNCSKLSTITILSITPPTLGSSPIPSGIEHIYVPAASVDAYKAADIWDEFADKISAIPA